MNADLIRKNRKLCPEEEAAILSDMRHLADEVFFTGPAEQICAARSVDRMVIGDSSHRRVTKPMHKELFGIVPVCRPDKWGWLTPERIKAAALKRKVT